MVRVYIVGLTLLWFVAGISGSSDIELSPSSVDLGEVWEGESVGVTFQVRNETGKSINLEKLRTSCSCVKTKVARKTIEPHGQVEVDLKVVRNTPGDFRDIVLVQTKEDGVLLTKEFNIIGRVRPTYVVKGNWLGHDESNGPAVEFARNEVCFLPNLSLPNFKEMAEPRLRISIDGSRPEDAITEGASVNVKSSLFTVQEHNLRADKEGKVHCTLLLNPVKKLEQGLYPDRLIVELGPDLKLSRRISFRIIGPVWSETATINFGSVAVGKVSSRNVTLHFQSDKTAWPQVNVIRTEPDTYSGAVTITDVAWDDKGKHTDVTLTFHPAMLSGTVKGFFHFKLFLGNKHPDPKGMAVENTDLVKLHVYGMVVGSHSQE